MNRFLQLDDTKICTQSLLPFASEKNNMAKKSLDAMALADRIRTVLAEMPGPEYGKQARLAEIARCGRPVVNHWLSQKQDKINGKHAMNISAALGYRIEWLMEGKGPKKKGEPAEAESEENKLFMVHVNAKEMEILSAYRAASPMDRALIEHVCQTMHRSSDKAN
jgi:hypothetical protein